jgi:hypothetical protein
MQLEVERSKGCAFAQLDQAHQCCPVGNDINTVEAEAWVYDLNGSERRLLLEFGVPFGILVDEVEAGVRLEA